MDVSEEVSLQSSYERVFLFAHDINIQTENGPRITHEYER